MRWAGHVARMGEERGVYRVLVGKPVGTRPLGRPRRRWVDNITMDLQEVGCGYMDWIGLAQDRDRWRTLVIAVMNLRVPWNAGNFLTSCKQVSFSRRTLHHGVSYVWISEQTANFILYSITMFVLGVCRKIVKSDYKLRSVLLSVCSHGTTRLPLKGFFMKFGIWVFFEKLSRKFNFH